MCFVESKGEGRIVSVILFAAPGYMEYCVRISPLESVPFSAFYLPVDSLTSKVGSLLVPYAFKYTHCLLKNPLKDCDITIVATFLLTDQKCPADLFVNPLLYGLLQTNNRHITSIILKLVPAEEDSASCQSILCIGPFSRQEHLFPLNPNILSPLLPFIPPHNLRITDSGIIPADIFNEEYFYRYKNMDMQQAPTHPKEVSQLLQNTTTVTLKHQYDPYTIQQSLCAFDTFNVSRLPSHPFWSLLELLEQFASVSNIKLSFQHFLQTHNEDSLRVCSFPESAETPPFPTIGVLISGRQGCGKTTFLQSFTVLLNTLMDVTETFVTNPIFLLAFCSGLTKVITSN